MSGITRWGSIVLLLVAFAANGSPSSRMNRVPAIKSSINAAAFAVGEFGGWLVTISVVKGGAGTRVAAALEKLTVHVHNFLCPSLLVKVVHVLRTDEETILRGVFKFRKGEVRRVRFGSRSDTPTHGIELPHQPGSASALCRDRVALVERTVRVGAV